MKITVAGSIQKDSTLFKYLEKIYLLYQKCKYKNIHQHPALEEITQVKRTHLSAYQTDKEKAHMKKYLFVWTPSITTQRAVPQQMASIFH